MPNVPNQFGLVLNAELLHQRGAMLLYRSRADVKTLCNFAVRLALAENCRRQFLRRPLVVAASGGSKRQPALELAPVATGAIAPATAHESGRFTESTASPRTRPAEQSWGGSADFGRVPSSPDSRHR